MWNKTERLKVGRYRKIEGGAVYSGTEQRLKVGQYRKIAERSKYNGKVQKDCRQTPLPHTQLSLSFPFYHNQIYYDLSPSMSMSRSVSYSSSLVVSCRRQYSISSNFFSCLFLLHHRVCSSGCRVGARVLAFSILGCHQHTPLARSPTFSCSQPKSSSI